MIAENPLDHVPLWLLYVTTAVLLYVASELGFRLGARDRARRNDSDRTPANAIMGSTLGLLAFLLAFTFGMSSTRFDSRRQLVLQEASAILQSYERAQFLPEEIREETTMLLREYVALRIRIPTLESMDRIAAAIERSQALQDALWAHARTMVDQPNAMLSAYLSSLASLTDLQMKRVRAAVWNRIPAPIEVVLCGVAFLGLMTLGYGAGLAANRVSLPTLLIVLAFAAVIAVIVDLERPRQTLFEISLEPMESVARRIEAPRLPGR